MCSSASAGPESESGRSTEAKRAQLAYARCTLRERADVDISYPPELPISERVAEISAAITDHQVVVVAGETGSGKSTQLPKICLELGRGVEGRIGHTQPRRLAARSVAERVAEELSVSVGNEVGFAVRFNDRVGANTRLKVMTDGILLAEIQRDRMLTGYDTLIIDEAHERSLNIDFLLGYLKQLLPRRPDLRLIITSATIDTERFSQHFGDAPVIEVTGRTHPVELRYRPLSGPEVAEDRDQSQGICDAVQDLVREGPGDILVFCSGEREIRDAADALGELKLNDTEIFPLFARLSSAEQHRVFQSHRGRRIVLATNVAETSLTVPGILFVVDPGTARISRYNLRTKVQRLPIEAVSQASANQRAGRCGRVAPGICIRLYSEDDFDSRPEFTEPEIQRTNLSSVILQMAALDLGEIEAFPFVQPPDRRNIRDGILLLEELGAVDPEHQGTKQWLTPLGRQLARLPLDPRLARMIIEADRFDCVHEVLVITAGMSIQDPRERPRDKQQVADEFHRRFADEHSDFLSLLHLWEYVNDEKKSRSSGQFRRMCKKEFLNWSRLREWQDLHSQLRRVSNDMKLRRNRRPAAPDDIHRALLAGLLSHVGQIRPPDKGKGGGERGSRAPDKRRTGREYMGARSSRFAIDRSSALAGSGTEWVMAAELVETNRMWARLVAPIEPEWAEDLAGSLATRSHDEPVWDSTRASAVVHERVTLFGLSLVVGRRVQYVNVDPKGARLLFIETALVDGRWEVDYPFQKQHAATRREAMALEARTRHPGHGVDRERLIAFYEARLGSGVANAKAFDRWWKRTVPTAPDVFDMQLADVTRADPDLIDAAAFPDWWTEPTGRFRVHYELDPDSESDGVTIELPMAKLKSVDAAPFTWNVPGHHEELIAGLLRSLPRDVRKPFVPIPDTAADVLGELERGVGDIRVALATSLTKRSGVSVQPSMLRLDAIPAHLRPTLLLLDESGEPFLESKDLEALKQAMDDRVRSSLDEATHDVERIGLTSWDLGSLPRTVETTSEGHTVKAYPALADRESAVDIVLAASVEEQTDSHWEGTRRLLRFGMAAPVKQLDRALSNEAKLALAAGDQGRASWYNDAITCVLDHLLERHGGLVWDADGFDALLRSVRADFADALVTAAGNVERLAVAYQDMRLALLQGRGSATSLADCRQHIERLVYDGFLTAVGLDRLADIERYVAGLRYRLDRLDDGQRDAQLMAQCHGLEADYAAAAARLPWSAEIEDIGWMLEEFRVSTFAQPIGAGSPVSAKRIRKALGTLTPA
ncbi:MAG: ATP-dependent helicase HrpA [Acidimicrobiales bacterium]|jgi:ATP-dependent helicase HrpA